MLALSLPVKSWKRLVHDVFDAFATCSGHCLAKEKFIHVHVNMDEHNHHMSINQAKLIVNAHNDN